MTATATWSKRRVSTRRPDQGRWRRHAWRSVTRLVGWSVVVAVAWLLLPLQYGGSLGTTVVSGQSMEPTYWTGDLVVTWRTDDYAVGDAVVYRVPEGEPGEGLHVVHRVAEETDRGFVMLGDNNDEPDLWTPTAEDVLGEVVLHVPEGGRWMRLLLSPLALALLCGVLVTLAVVSSGKDDEDEPGEGDDPDNDPLGPAEPDLVHPQVRRRLLTLPPPRRSPRTPDRPHPALLGSPWARTTLVALAAAGVALPVVGATAGPGASASTLGGLQTTDLTAMRIEQRPVGELTDVTTSVSVTSSNATSYCAEVTVSTTSPSWVRWQATIDRTTPGLTPVQWLDAQPGNAWNVTTIGFSAAAQSWVVRGAGWNDHVRADTPRTFGYCSPYSQNAPLTDADVSVSITSQSGNGANTSYCAGVTVSTTSTAWVRWRATVGSSTPGLGGVQYRLTSAPVPQGAVPDAFSSQGNTWSWTVTGTSGNRFIKAGSPATWSYCK